MRASPNLAMFAKSLRSRKRWYDINLETSLGRKLYIFLTIALPMVPLVILSVKISTEIAANAAYDGRMARYVHHNPWVSLQIKILGRFKSR